VRPTCLLYQFGPGEAALGNLVAEQAGQPSLGANFRANCLA
jgi:hypothetical protein